MFSKFSLFIALLLACSGPTALADNERLLTVEDMINFAEIGDPETTDWVDYSKKTASFSPSRKRVAVLVRKGNTTNETLEGQLLVFETAALFQDAKPTLVAAFASSNNYQPIALIRWIDDNTIVFAATDGEAPSQIYRADLKTGKVTPLTQEPTGIKWYGISADGDRLVASSYLPKPISTAEDPNCIKNACRVRAKTIRDAINGGSDRRFMLDGNLSVYDRQAGTHRQVQRPEQASFCFAELAGGLAPDGRYGLRLCSVKEWPEWWTEYTFDNGQTGEQLQRKNENYARQYFLVDLNTGASRPATGAVQPFTQSEPLWIDGGRRVILAGALEPLAGTDGVERLRRASGWGVLVLDVESGDIQSVAKFDADVVRVGEAKWDAERETLTVATRDKDKNPLPLLSLQRKEGRWAKFDAPKQAAKIKPSGIELILEQSPNQRPRLYVTDPATGAKKLLLDPNAWMDGIKLGRVEEVKWDVGESGHWRGMLYFPPDYEEGRRYPLVIQTHGIWEGEFSLTGYARNFAAQPLAARGMMVLQVEENLSSTVGTPDEWPAVQAGYEAAIDYLDGRHLIDRSRVGIVGWSRSGPWASYLLTHSEYPIAAAAYTSSGDFGWWLFLAEGAQAELNSLYGTIPFGPGLEPWLEMSPSFNMDRIQAPVLLWGRTAFPLLWDIYAGLKGLDKPVEYWMLVDPEHDVFKINHRLKTNHSLVDWFDFWLQGIEDPDPAKAEQYARWRALREQHKRDLAKPRPPLLDWTSVPKEQNSK